MAGKSLVVLLTGLIVVLAGQDWAIAHEGENHDPGITVDPGSEQQPLPLDIVGNFELIDHSGNTVSHTSYYPDMLLVFFGYTSCKNMCSISLNRIGDALTLLGDEIPGLTPLVITVDPERDTPERLKNALAEHHPALIGLTGSPEQLADAYRNFKQKPVNIGEDWQDDEVISHSSYIYLLDQTGSLKTLFPPILNPDSMAKIIRKYLDNPV